jgi:hypothetical protein
LDITCLDYKDLVKSPDKVWEGLTRFCNLPKETGTPLEAYQKYVLFMYYSFRIVCFRDSQRGAFLSRGVLATTDGKKSKKPEDWLEDLQKFLDAFELDEEVKFLPSLLSYSSGNK